MYNFGTQLGSEVNISVFTALGDPLQSNFDDHDGQMLVGFNTSAQVPTGRPIDQYRIISATLTVRNNRGLGFRYDPTHDSWRTFVASTDPEFQADADLGRPIELYGAGYRNGWTALTFLENSPFSVGDSTVLPQRGVRNVFAAQFDASGAATDVSNNVLTGRFETRPMAIGVATPTASQPNAVNPGDLVPTNTDFVFNVSFADAGTIRYFRDSLAQGRLNLIVTSMAVSAQQGGSPPRFYSKEASGPTPTGAIQPARLSLSVCVGAPTDWDCNATTNIDDIFVFLNSWFAGTGDFDADGSTTIDDIFIFLNAWFSASP
jgi:hypothetical protein